jgi:hypothetical protein
MQRKFLRKIVYQGSAFNSSSTFRKQIEVLAMYHQLIAALDENSTIEFVAATGGTRNSEYGNRTNFGSMTRIFFKFRRSPSVPRLDLT